METFFCLRAFINDSSNFGRETKRRVNVLQMSVEEVLQSIEEKIAVDLDEICHKVEGLPKMNDKIISISVSTYLLTYLEST